MYECFDCGKKYDQELAAKKCCNETIYYEDGEFRLPKKMYIKPGGKQHTCPNMTQGGKKWLTWLSVDEKCPMCDYTYRPR